MVWFRAHRLDLAVVATILALPLVIGLALRLRAGAYADVLSVAPAVWAVNAAVVCLAASVSQPRPEHLLCAAGRRLAWWRGIEVGVVLGQVGALVVALAWALGSWWFVTPGVQSSALLVGIVLAGSQWLPASWVAAGAIGYCAVCYGVGAGAGWNLVLHHPASGLTVCSALVLVLGVLGFVIRGPVPSQPLTNDD